MAVSIRRAFSPGWAKRSTRHQRHHDSWTQVAMQR
jgi:hypothetical protein